MKFFFTPALILFLFTACTDDNNGPDVSGIKVNVAIERFDQDFFAIDTVNPNTSLPSLQAKYPSLYPIFVNNILGLSDSNKDSGISRFIRQNRFISDAVNREFSRTDQVRKEFEQAFRYVNYYFPDYKLPKVITIVGPPDALAQTASGEPTPNFIGPDFLGISLQFYLGRDFPVYHDGFFVTNVAPEFRSRRFDKKYLVADAMKLVADDIYPDRSQNRGLIEQMLEKGKQWWLLDKFLPNVPDTIKTGYTREQLNWCKQNEGLIWNEIITTQKDLYTKDPSVIQSYIGEAPYTQALSAESPGNIGPWIGWQIIKKFAEKNSSLNVEAVLNTGPGKILELAKYKPK